MSRNSDWIKSGVVNRNYHIVNNLAKDERVNKIISVDFLPFTYKRAFKIFLKEHIFNNKRGEFVYKSLTTQAWQASDKIYVYSTINSVINKNKIIIEIDRLIKSQNMQDNLVVFNFNPMHIDYFDKFNQSLNIFDAVDNWTEHSSYAKYKNLLQNNYEIINQKSDLIYSVSQDMCLNFKNSNCIWLPNAVDYDHFQSNNKAELLNDIKMPIIGFLGILQDRIDIELLIFIAKKNPDKTIVLAGPVWKNFAKEKLKNFTNIIFTGPVKYQDIPKFYNSFSVGIIPYKVNRFTQSTNSMKYYEYLASGIPVVSTNAGGIEKFSEVIYSADTYEQFNANIQKAIKSDSQEQRKTRKNFVQNMTWKARANEILSDIFSKI